MKKFFLSVLTLAAFTGGIALTSCGGGGGSGSEEDWARCFNNVTLMATEGIGLMKVQLLDPISYRSLNAVYTFSSDAPYSGYFNISSMKVEGDTVTITATFGIEDGALLNAEGFLEFLGMGGVAKSCKISGPFGAEYTFHNINDHHDKSATCQFQGKATFYRADGAIIIGDSNYIDEEDDPDPAQQDYIDLSRRDKVSFSYEGRIKIRN
ncbi:MAG: hypothetical protein IKK45_03600 [Akkermansia sp.]|nr:hypothetical protein [Akkermansia sp.]